MIIYRTGLPLWNLTHIVYLLHFDRPRKPPHVKDHRTLFKLYGRAKIPTPVLLISKCHSLVGLSPSHWHVNFHSMTERSELAFSHRELRGPSEKFLPFVGRAVALLKAHLSALCQH